MTRTFKVQNLASRPLKITGVSAKEGRCTVLPAGKLTLPATVAPQEAAEFVVTINLGGTAGGVLRDEITIATDNIHTPALPLPIYVRSGPPPKPIVGPGRLNAPPVPAPLPAPR